MIRPGVVLGIARAEARLARRLVRYWVFTVIATIVGCALYAYYAWLHWLASGFSATVSVINPRYLVMGFGTWYLMVFAIGLVFLGFDVRSRDSRERMHEVLDSLPYSNLELVLGKFLGVFIPAWIPLLVMVGILTVAGLMLDMTVEPWSLVAFTTFMAIPAFTFILGVVFFFSLLTRHRLAASILSLAVLGSFIAVSFFVPFYAVPLMDPYGGYQLGFPSDIVGGISDATGWFQRLAVLLVGLGFLLLGVAVHPRNDDSPRTAHAGTGGTLLALGLAILGMQVYANLALLAQHDEWKGIHESRVEEPAPDVVAVTAEADLRPGRTMEIEAELVFRAPTDAPLDSALFSLNPGLSVDGITGADGSARPFTHENGLLDVELPGPLAAGAETSLTFRISGLPDPTFAYFDAVVHPLRMTAQDGNMFLLGYDPYLFDREFVALMPGARWLPAAGPEVGRSDPKVRPTDFFQVDMTVELPEGWIAVSAGRREELSTEDGRARVRFAPAAPVPDVAIVAGEFVSRSAEIDGITAEILLHESHTENLEVFEDAGGEIHDWVVEKLEDTKEVGLTYPYEALTFVEVPIQLRTWAGGWRLDTTLAPPSMMLVRECGFPTANFERHFEDPSDFESLEGGMPRAKLEYLLRFFNNDFNGGNPFVGSSRNLFLYQTAGRGDEGLPLDFVFEDLSRRIVVDKSAYFSAFLFDRDMGTAINQSIGRFFAQGGQQSGQDFADAMIDLVTAKAGLWDAILGVSLADLDPWEEPEQAIDVLAVKGGAMAKSMLDELGREKTGQLLTVLRERRRGLSYTRNDVVEAGAEVGADLEPWIVTWIEQTELPGFLAPRVEAYRVQDAEDGSPRYQILVTVVNGETVPGLIRVEYAAGEPGPETERGASDPIRVEAAAAVDIGVVTSKPPRMVRLAPYLSLNRAPFTVRLPALDPDEIREEEPFLGFRDSDWVDIVDEAIVVDDLDDGFAVETVEGGGGLRLAGKTDEDEETDQGLPVHQIGSRPKRWSRHAYPGAFGKYRHTVAMIRGGDGNKFAVFSAAIDRAGPWDLEIHFPESRGRAFNLVRAVESWKLVVEDESGTHDVEFNAKNGETGWNNLGTFELADGEVRVKLSNESEGRLVIADAIRWVPQGN
jgi:ABC-type transport system involved in multi-copper enzyme maturation permease subunit